MFKSQADTKLTPKAEETSLAILNTALKLFRDEGFDKATMRDIAKAAGVATGAAYYYFPSKEAIVMEFYRRSSAEMQPQIAEVLEQARSFEERLKGSIQVKLDYFQPNRGVLRALLRGADPKHPLSPFGEGTKEIRETDMACFERVLADSGMRVSKDLVGELPGLLWFFQMGVILFWVIDDSPQQTRTSTLLDVSSKLVANLVRISSLPLMRPLRKSVLSLIHTVKGQ